MNAKVFNLISGVNDTSHLVQHELFNCKCRLNVNLNPNSNLIRIMVNVDMSLKNSTIEAFVKKVICGILVHVIVGVIKHVKLTNI